MPDERLPHRKPRLSLCPESMFGLGMAIPTYLLIEQTHSDCFVGAKPCGKSCEDRNMVFVCKDRTVQSWTRRVAKRT